MFEIPSVPYRGAFVRQASYSSGDLDHFSIYGPEGGDSQPRLPLGPFRLFNRITAISSSEDGTGKVVAEYDITPDAWFFPFHFVGNPLMPGSLQIEAMLQLTGFYGVWLGARGEGMATGMAETSFCHKVQPTHRLLRYEIEIQRVREGSMGVFVRADGVTLVDGVKAASTKELKAFIRRQM